MIHFDGIVYALQAYGGISVYFNALCTEFSRRGLEIGLYLPAGNLMGKPPSSVETKLVNSTNRLLERYRDYECDAPVGHSSYYRLPSSGAKSVVTVYDFTYERYFKTRQKILHCWQKNRAIRQADAVICISESTRNDLFKFLPDVPRNKVHVVHLGINSAFLQGYTHSPTFVSPTSQPYFLYVGARSTYKNFLPVLAALKDRTEHLICVGGGPITEQEESYLDKSLKGRVHHLTWANDEDLAILYRHSLGLVFPSLYEGFGIPVAEAMACGCPVIASNTSSVPEVAGQAAYLLDSVTADTLGVAFDAIQERPRRAEMIALGIDRAAFFSWQNCCNATHEIYDLLTTRRA
ncbi:glycosyltransferase family 4 protein [Limnobacter parvus]|uniref:Glycosyltransferase family 4 protein n=1 Tax=Limnobacter parvus TaxID=2939690 RepID=A0ABT1XD91_9BURK|nr:glycosyltransferase family 1 protein [Limnobacter parvus]MCR2745241.1 glycosyltransferase family 4 protein [Limnobacter parvus]